MEGRGPASLSLETGARGREGVEPDDDKEEVDVEVDVGVEESLLCRTRERN